MDYEKDVESLDAIIRAIYDVISGPAGPKDWARERFLMHPTARMMRGLPAGAPAGRPPTPGLAVFSTEEFIASTGPRLAAEDFYEYETGREVFRFGRLAHVASAYASTHALGQPPFARGDQQHAAVVRRRTMVGDGRALGLGVGRELRPGAAA